MAGMADRPFDGNGAAPTNPWGWTMACGVLLALAGVFSIAAPGLTSAAIAVVLGWILVFSGIAGIVLGLRARSSRRRWTDIMYGIGSLLVGLLVLIDPVAGAASLALLFAVWLAWRGAVGFGAARVAGPGRLRGLLLLIGVIDWAFAFLLVIAWPFPAVQMLGVLVGVSLLLGGLVTILAAWQLRDLSPV